jgi:glycosyltransferase involved in cell wall biosynthesis
MREKYKKKTILTPPAGPRVLVLPCYKSNPYSFLFVSSLQKCGLDIQCVNETGIWVLPKMILKRKKPHILHLHWQHRFLLAHNKSRSIVKSTLFILEILLLRMLGVRLVWTVHNIHNHEGKFVSIEIFFCGILAKAAAGIIVHAESAKQEAIKAFKISKKEKIHVIPHANYIDYYPNTIKKQEARKKLDIPGEKFVLLSLGKIRSYKGIKHLVRGFIQFADKDSLLILAGNPHSPADKEEVHSLVKSVENIRFYSSYISDEEIQVFMNAADAAVLPYENILTSGAVILAMSFAKPVITPSHPFMKEVLNPEKNFLYEPGDEEGLLKALNEAYNQRQHLEEKGKYNFEQVKKDSWRNISLKTKEVYLLNSPSKCGIYDV